MTFHPIRAFVAGRRLVVLGSALLVGLAWSSPARAYSSYYTSDCAACHGSTTSTCNGCHSHGTHSSSAKTDINVTGTIDRGTYAPGATMTVTITGGYRTGWIRALLLDQNMQELARSSCPGGQGGCTISAYPVTLRATAPSTPGSYTWAIAWYGNFQYEGVGASFDAGTSPTLAPGSFTPDASNAHHGYETVALPSFTVTGAAAVPSIAVSPTSLSFGTVSIGGSSSSTFAIQNAGTVALNVSGVARCTSPATTTEFTWSTPIPTPFTLNPGSSVDVSVAYAPTDFGGDGGCLTVTSDDPQRPTLEITLDGTGQNASTGSSTDTSTTTNASHASGCGTGDTGGLLSFVALAVMLARRRRTSR